MSKETSNLAVDGGLEPIEVADRVWWVGSVRPDETFQCHSYLIEAGDNSVLIDPGSVLTIEETLRRAARVVPLSSIRWLVCHHPDPDIASGLPMVRRALPGDDVRVVTEWRAETFLRYYDAGIPFYRVEEHEWELPLSDDQRLRFVLTPYLHFPGALCSFEVASGVLFSSDLFGGFTDGSQLVATDESYFEAMRPFHEHYMPSHEILASGLASVRRAFDPIALIAPQHGCIIPEPLVATMFDRLAELECGIFLIARDDLDIARLLQVSTALRHINDALVLAHDFPDLAAIAERVLPDVLPIESLEIFAQTAEEGILRFSAEDHFHGTAWSATEPKSAGPALEFELPGDGAPAQVVIGLHRQTTLTTEVNEMFGRLALPVRAALNRHLEQRHVRNQSDELRDHAQHDALTGLYNRHALGELAKIDQQYGVLMIDIDHFELVNDKFGHGAGDEVLRAVATAISKSVRSEDVTIRYGGEEMLVLVMSADRELTLKVAQRILACVEALEFSDLPSLGHVTVSIGAAIHHADQSIEVAVAAADSRLYDAKNEGRNRIRATW